MAAIVSSASASPVHLPIPALDLNGFNRACGVAADSQGDVYVASAGESKVRIFDPEHSLLASISNANEPCGLAVDSKGKLYVSESKTGNIVRYVPNAYPLSGAPSYGAPITIDASGKAKGIAVDLIDDRLYVAEGTAIATYDSAGALGPIVGEGELSKATGVAAYTSASGIFHVGVAEAEGDLLQIFSGKELAVLKLRKTIEGVDQDHDLETPDQKFGFGVAGAYLTAEPGSGHLFLYDASHSVLDELEATGEFLDQISDPALIDAQPSAVAAYPQRNEVQTLKFNASGGSFTLTFEGQSTSLSVGSEKPTAAEVQAAIQSLSTVGVGNVSVFGRFNNPEDGSYTIAFIEALGDRDVAQLEADGSGLTGGSHTATVTTEIQGSGPGRLYVTAGAAAGAKVLTFASLTAPSRPPRPDLSFKLTNTCGVAVDSHGNRYVAADKFIHVYNASGTELTKIEDANPKGGPCDLAVDSAGNVYALDGNIPITIGGGRAVYFTPEVFPPTTGTKYSTPIAVATPTNFDSPNHLEAIGLDPASDHLFVTQPNQTIEFDSAANGSKVFNADFGSGLGIGYRSDIAAYGTNGDVYIIDLGSGAVVVLDPSGKEVLTRITGAGSPKGPFGGGRPSSIAVDQSNGHLITFSEARRVAEEFDPSGAFVTEFGDFKAISAPSEVAIDNSGGPGDGNAYVAYLGDLTAFGPLAYGEPPVAVTEIASGVGGGNATLNGTVNPRGFDLEACRFEYETDAQYVLDGESFTSANLVPCAESFAEIGKGTSPVPVHADLSGLDPEGRYRFRLVAEDEYGASEGDAGLFGPPVLTIKSALPVSYIEATVRAKIDPAGLATKYRVEYGTGESYGSSTAPVELGPGAGPTDLAVHLFGLAEGTTYHYRFVVENELKTIDGVDQTLTTRERSTPQSCTNAEFRSGHSAGLPDCRAYELVTPADTRGTSPYASPAEFNGWEVTPTGPLAGDSLAFVVNGTLTGFEGNGRADAYRALRGSGAHPVGGWASSFFAPTYAEIGGGDPRQRGIAADQEYSIWELEPSEAVDGTLPDGIYLRTPAGFELLGKGSLGSDPKAQGHSLTAGATHAIFSSKAQLEGAAAPESTEALYDRTPGGTNVVSIAPGGSSFGPGEDTSYVASTEDGTAVLFKVGNVLYLRHGGETIEVAVGLSTFAGVSEGGGRVFYAAGSGGSPASLLACDIAGGPCAGPEATQTATQIAVKSIFINVSADGSRAYFSSKEALSGGEENEAGEIAEEGEDNLYLWNAESGDSRFVAQIDASDFDEKAFGDSVSLAFWTQAVGPEVNGLTGRANSPTRSTSDGTVLVFQSHAQLTSYANEGKAEVYRFDAVAATDQLTCISCDQVGAPPDGNARLQSIDNSSPAKATTLIPNVTDDGKQVFFESDDHLLPDDANAFRDVYEWKAKGTGSCERAGGCLALISSGQGEHASYLYSMTPDGHDVFFRTQEKLVGPDIPGTPSIYDARIDGGIPDPPQKAPCQGDACQGTGSTPPVLPSSPGATLGQGGNVNKAVKPGCAKGERKVRKAGKTRCVKPHKHKRHTQKRRANGNWRASR